LKNSDSQNTDRKSTDFDWDQKKCIVSDLDGTIYLGNKPIDGTVEFMKKSGNDKEFFFLTNNTSKIPEDYVNRLNINNAFLVANQRYTEFLKKELPDININGNPDNCQAVIVAYDTELTYEKLKSASLILQDNNVKFLATHCDKVCPTEQGPIPDAGSILALLETSTGRKPDKIFGKPNQALLASVVKKYKKNEIAIVGDRLYTDKALADNTGIDFILVLSGESTRADAERSESSPALILNDLGDLLDK